MRRSSTTVAGSVLAGLLLLAGPLVPLALPVAAVTLPVGAAALVLARRSSRPLVVAIAAIAVWLAGGIAGAWLVGGASGTGLAWVLAVLFVVPLPLVPWLYAATFRDPAP